MRPLALLVACLVVPFGVDAPVAAQVPNASIGEPAIPLYAMNFVAAPETPDPAAAPVLLPPDLQPGPVTSAPAPTLAFEYSEAPPSAVWCSG